MDCVIEKQGFLNLTPFLFFEPVLNNSITFPVDISGARFQDISFVFLDPCVYCIF
jgi:hypothetical protein